MNETNTLKRIANRLKKIVILMVLIPVLTGAVAYLLSSHLPNTYTAEGKIILGNFQDEKITNIGALPEFMTTPSYLKEIDQNHVLNVDKLLKELEISTDDSSKTITFSIKGQNRDEVVKSLNKLIRVFMNKSNSVYQQHVNSMQQTIAGLKKENVSGLAAIKKEELLAKSKEELLALRKSIFKAPISIDATHSDPKKRAVLGFLIGIMLDVAILLLPEIFRNPEK